MVFPECKIVNMCYGARRRYKSIECLSVRFTKFSERLNASDTYSETYISLFLKHSGKLSCLIYQLCSVVILYLGRIKRYEHRDLIRHHITDLTVKIVFYAFTDFLIAAGNLDRTSDRIRHVVSFL